MKLKKKELIPGNWYYHNDNNKYCWIFKFTHLDEDGIYGNDWYDLYSKHLNKSTSGWNLYEEMTELRLATFEELSKLNIIIDYELY